MRAIKLKLAELYECNKKAQRIKLDDLSKNYKKIQEVIHYQGLSFISKIIGTEIINWHPNKPLIGHFGTNKTREFIKQKYYWSSLYKDIKAYVTGCNICLAAKAVKHKS